jgi:hypothetical protein
MTHERSTSPQNRYNPAHIQQVSVGVVQEDGLVHLPEYLHDFDPPDQKWLAIFLVGGARTLFNAADSDYVERAADIDSAGVTIVELCPEELHEVEG